MAHSDLEMHKAFLAPFDSGDIQWRVGSRNKEKTRGMALAYIDARAVMRRLDEVCGPLGWRSHLTAHDKTFICCLEVWSEERQAWITRSDAADATDIGESKGGASAALKRAAVQFGIGAYLYELESPWVALEKGAYIGKSEMVKLAKLLGAKKAAAAKREQPDPEPEAEPPTEEELGLSDDEKDKIWAANDVAVKAIYGEPTAAQQYECLEFALSKVGVEALDQVSRKNQETVIAWMRTWFRERKAKEESQ